MPAIEILTGVAQCNLTRINTTAVPDFTSLVSDVSEISPNVPIVLNSDENPLVVGTNYKLTYAPVCMISDKLGYTVGKAAPLSTAFDFATAGDGLLVHIANSDFPSGLLDMVAIAFFIQTNVSNPQICGFQYIPTDGSDFYHLITSTPVSRAMRWPASTLTAGTADTYLGTRSGFGVDWYPLIPTGGGVKLMHRYERAPYRPDTGLNSEFRVTQGTDLEFSVLSGSDEFIMQAVGGNWAQYTIPSSGPTYEFSATDLASALAFMRGNHAIRIDMPVSSLGRFTTRLMLGNVDFNVQDITEDTTKTEMYKLDFKLQAAQLDYLMANIHNTSMISYY